MNTTPELERGADLVYQGYLLEFVVQILARISKKRRFFFLVFHPRLIAFYLTRERELAGDVKIHGLEIDQDKLKKNSLVESLLKKLPKEVDEVELEEMHSLARIGVFAKLFCTANFGGTEKQTLKMRFLNFLRKNFPPRIV